MAAPLLPLTGTLLPRGNFGNGLHEPGAAHTLEDYIVTISNILCAHLGGKYFLSHNFKTINMIVNIQNLQNQQLQQQIAKLANNLGQLHHREIKKGNKQANNEKKETNKQQLQKTLTGISIGDQRPFLHLIRPLPTSWKYPDFSIF